MRTVAAIASSLVLGCVHANVAPRPLSEALALEMRLGARDLQHSTNGRARLLLRNLSEGTVEFCQLDGGVSISAIVDQATIPLKGYGAVTDAACYKPTRLGPGETTEFNETFPTPLSPGAAELVGMIRIYSTQNEDAIIRSAPVPVTIQ